MNTINPSFSSSIQENEIKLLNVIAERETIYEFLPMITSTSIIQQYNDYTIHPGTRYTNYKSLIIRPDEYRYLLNPKLLMNSDCLT